MNIFICVIVVDDDVSICDVIVDYLLLYGYQVCVVVDVIVLDVLLQVECFDLIIFDWMMFGEDGLLVCCWLQVWVILILMLLVMGVVLDCVIGLEMGVDDYLVKLFDLCELLVWVCVLLCRQDKLCVQVVSELWFDGW